MSVKVYNNIAENKQIEKANSTAIITLIAFMSLFLSALTLFRTFCFTSVIVNGPSMNYTLSQGDILIVDMACSIHRKDVVVFSYGNRYLVKRVVGLPGETIKIERGVVHVSYTNENGDYCTITLKEDYVSADNANLINFPETTIGENQYFVLGDNRREAMDSEEIGCIEKKDMLGVVHQSVIDAKNTFWKYLYLLV